MVAVIIPLPRRRSVRWRTCCPIKFTACQTPLHSRYLQNPCCRAALSSRRYPVPLLSEKLTVAGESAKRSYLADFIELIPMQEVFPAPTIGQKQRFSVWIPYTPPFDSARSVVQAFES